MFCISQKTKTKLNQYAFRRVTIHAQTSQCVCMHAGSPASNQSKINKSLMFQKETLLSTYFHFTPPSSF